MRFQFKYSLQTRIFLSMIGLVILTAGLLVIITTYHYKNEAEDFHQEKLERKENAIKSHIEYIKRTTTYPVRTDRLSLIFKDKIYEIQDIHDTSINIYDLQGNLLKSSRASFYKESNETNISQAVLDSLANSLNKKYILSFEEDGQSFKSSYTYLLDNYFKPIGILNLAYVEDDEFMEKELEDFLSLLLTVNLVIFFFAVLLALFLSKYITKSLSRISNKIKAFSLEKTNPKISLKNTGSELRPLISAYNEMIDELEESAKKLAETERQEAWQLMARQVAHEIKNPLTPMRLSVQSFQNQYHRDKVSSTDVDEFSNTMIQQIDTLSTIATAFSDFAKMPEYHVEVVDVNEVIKFTLDIFKGEDIIFTPHKTPLFVKIDKTRLIRVITNLIKNAIQATKDNEHCHVEISVNEEKEHVVITVKDNGTGIPIEIIDRIFEPQFTTKSSGMGLGLSMVKRIIDKSDGQIEAISEPGQSTIFRITLPKITSE